MVIEVKRKNKVLYYILYSEQKPTGGYDPRTAIATFTSLDTAALIKRYLEGCFFTEAETLEARKALKQIDKGE